jgi:hypothetical protein
MTAATSGGRRRNLIENFQSNHDCGHRGQCVEFGSVLAAQRGGDHSKFHLLEITALWAVADNLNQKRQAGLSAWLFFWYW